jgi:hypothetical protein
VRPLGRGHGAGRRPLGIGVTRKVAQGLLDGIEQAGQGAVLGPQAQEIARQAVVDVEQPSERPSLAVALV